MRANKQEIRPVDQLIANLKIKQINRSYYLDRKHKVGMYQLNRWSNQKSIPKSRVQA